ncbi:MAG: SpoIIE family protein phosphatase [Flavobacteriales bacterium]|nr:SpoIIE family protein phosphatase [Flavobacteriales bacterium]
MRRHLPFLLVIVAITSFKNVSAQTYDLEIYGSESGLASTEVNDICQDKLGYIWVATNSGVSKFDGKRFKNYGFRNGLAENICISIICDNAGQIWVGHPVGGISIIGRDSIWTINDEQGLANNEVQDIFQDKEGKIWAATFGGVSVFDGSKWTTKTTKNGLASNSIRAISQDVNGNILVGTYGSGLNIIRGEKIDHLHMGNGLVNNYVTSIYLKKNHVLIGTLGGLSIWDDGKFVNTLSANGLDNNQINDLSVNRVGDIWLATYNGAIRIRKGNLLRISEENGMPSNEVLAVMTDSEGNTWLGTRKGLVRVKNLAFTHYFSTEDIEIAPSYIFKDTKGQIWAGNEAGGVLKYDGHSFVKAFDDPDINDRQISSIAEDGFGNLWFGTMDFGGLFQYTGNKLYIYSDEFGLADNNINCLAKDAEGNLIIGTPSGLSAYDGSGFLRIPLTDNFSTDNVTSLKWLADGKGVVGTADGSVFILDEFRVEKKLELNTNSPITDICESPFGLAISSQTDGLYLVKDDAIRQVGTETGLVGASIRSLASMGGKLFIGTIHGLEQLSLVGDSIRVREYDQSKGFLGKTCKRGAMLTDGNSIWIGTSEGITRFTENERADDLFEPQTFLTEIQLDYNSVNWTKRGFDVSEMGLPQGLSLSYMDNSIRIYFKGINHNNPKGVTFKWILEGFESNWNPPTDQEFANYPNLPPGDYTFKLIACNSLDICNQEPITFQFKITPPFYRTWGFYITLGIILVIATYMFILLRERRLLEEKRILEATVQERTKELREQKEIVEDQNKHITESIDYAKNIQMAVLPSEEDMKEAFDDHFVFYRPKDTVGGDFYWVFSEGNISWAAAVDCTGHGVAGAFMSMIGTDLLNQIIIEKKIDTPAKVLEEMDKGIKLAFAQSAKEFESDQGMDMALIRIDRKKKEVQFAGAQRPLYLMVDDELIQIEGNKLSISCAEQRRAEEFENHIHKIKGNTIAYLFSDGIVDQFGGPKGRKFMIRRLREFLHETKSLTIAEQAVQLNKTFDDWKGEDHNQIDDVMLLGIRL